MKKHRSAARARVLADIGGTNARFAWQDGPGAPLQQVTVLRCADFESLESAFREYLRRIDRPLPRAAAIAIANPVLGDRVRMTNHSWEFSISQMQASLGLERLVVLNDFTALALSLTALDPGDVRQVGRGTAVATGPRGIIGPGTGLGVSGLLPDRRGGWIPIEGEGGHATLPTVTAREEAVGDYLQGLYGHVSAERAVSGPGLADLYRALGAIDQVAGIDLSAEQVTHAALVANEPRAVEAANLLCAFLGTVAGNLALTLGATGGVYIAGGIVPRLGGFFDASPFRERFEAKGRFTSYVAQIPTFVIVSETSPALIGVQQPLDRPNAGEPPPH